MYSITSSKDFEELSPFIIIGAGGGGEKLSNFKGVETAGFLDDAPAKQGTEFCGHIVGSDLKELVETTDSKTVAIMLPIGAEATALKYAVEAMCLGQNVLTSFRSLPLNENQTLLKVAQQNGVQIKEISSRLDNVEKVMGKAPEKVTEVLPKITYKHKKPLIFVGGTSQECGKRTTTKKLGEAAKELGMNAKIFSTDEMGLEEPTDINFRAGSLSVMDVPAAIMGTVKYLEEEEDADIIFVEGQSSLTETGNPHPKGLSASILFGAQPDAVVLCHRENHPFREPVGIQTELNAIEAVEPTTKVIALSINRRNAEDLSLEDIEDEFNLPTVDLHTDSNGGIKRLLETVLEYVGEK
ncbi:MAG: DUF1611 domain-containing protein [Methanosphaera sp.]|uniref:DUF1611 domain-containing protein n=1 Tax=Methanosphaera sp. TaxID=2666342 RepID=UPI0025CE1177|nr:DUF1611 domain-containing protein [Methanosphaera sp.]MCI5867147.1 DUF1611 domain-containing protein [Methanosphaera sp.]MDD6534784.1 DUF1611 domain-containing protein [Methanosphaera sp.]MDY3955548.1 DUF1611 domain-containing protein [Methanosphaera sp.]